MPKRVNPEYESLVMDKLTVKHPEIHDQIHASGASETVPKEANCLGEKEETY